eukprot:4211893-Pyramimonas_sp.AAC.1
MCIRDRATAGARRADVAGADVVTAGEALAPEWAPPVGLRALGGSLAGPCPEGERRQGTQSRLLFLRVGMQGP